MFVFCQLGKISLAINKKTGHIDKIKAPQTFKDKDLNDLLEKYFLSKTLLWGGLCGFLINLSKARLDNPLILLVE